MHVYGWGTYIGVAAIDREGLPRFVAIFILIFVGFHGPRQWLALIVPAGRPRQTKGGS